MLQPLMLRLTRNAAALSDGWGYSYFADPNSANAGFGYPPRPGDIEKERERRERSCDSDQFGVPFPPEGNVVFCSFMVQKGRHTFWDCDCDSGPW